MMLSDAELLARYTGANDEQAFAEVVDRYLNLVYSAALRYTDGHPQMADDVAQEVFTDLARKGPEVMRKLERGQTLVGWLYTSAHFAATSLCRTETRRHTRERKAMAMDESDTTPTTDTDPTWPEIRPWLDQAMRDLTATDRDAILLRYFTGKDLRTVGSVLGYKFRRPKIHPVGQMTHP